MVSWLLFLLPLSVTAASGGRPKLLGVHPTALSKYTPSKSNTWTCLDGSKQISWDAVNDDYCDCSDGSDEPEPDCCDGSDELPGVCKDICKQVGEDYRKKRDEELKLRRTGAKIRSTYIAFAHKEKKRLEELVVTLTKQVAAKEKEVEKLREHAERTESLSQAALEHKKQSPLYQSLLNHNKALQSLRREYKKHAERERQLGDVLDALRRGYNPNYQDMAVLEAVRGWEELAGLPHINDVKKGDGEEDVVEETREPKLEEPVNDDLWTADELNNELDDLLQSDYTALLLDHEEHISAPTEDSILFKITSYLPEDWLPHYEAWKDSFVEWLETLGVVRSESSGTSSESTRAQQILSEATQELNDMKREMAEAQSGVTKIFDPEHFGARGEWKKLDDLCIELNSGDYTYELCLFKEAKQKPIRGGTNFSLGKFKSWNPDATPGSPEYYRKQVYQNGARCWNGPERSVVVLLSCGTENAVTSVQELEKCEYQYTATSPALCTPPEEDKNQNREEL
ncbi:hypothetical protein MD484_g5925, partial [Candolleomyces efflorescens]